MKNHHHSLLVFGVLIVPILVAATEAAFSSKIFVHKNDVIIADENGALKCDHVDCPREASLCHVLKEALPKNRKFLQRISTCFARDGTVLLQSTKIFFNKYKNHTDYFDVIADRNGLIIANEENRNGFHFSTHKLSALDGKDPRYLKGIQKTINEIHETMQKRAKKLRSHGKNRLQKHQ